MIWSKLKLEDYYFSKIKSFRYQMIANVSCLWMKNCLAPSWKHFLGCRMKMSCFCPQIHQTFAEGGSAKPHTWINLAIGNCKMICSSLNNAMPIIYCFFMCGKENVHNVPHQWHTVLGIERVSNEHLPYCQDGYSHRNIHMPQNILDFTGCVTVILSAQWE